MSTIHAAPGNRLVLYSVPWSTYTRLLRILDETHVRLTYDRGTLEIMTLSFGHEHWAYLLGRLIDALTEELALPIAGGGSTTFKRRQRKRGLEPDQCYWIAHESAVRGKTRVDLRTDPPPDLVVEVDVSRSSLNRMRIYARLGMPEVWRYDRQRLGFHVLGSDGRYHEQPNSLAFPHLRAAELVPFLAQGGTADANAVVRQFRAWVRQQTWAGGAAPPAP